MSSSLEGREVAVHADHVPPLYVRVVVLVCNSLLLPPLPSLLLRRAGGKEARQEKIRNGGGTQGLAVSTGIPGTLQWAR